MAAVGIPQDTLDVLLFSMPGTNTRGAGLGPPPMTVSGIAPATGPASGGTPNLTLSGTNFTGQSIQVEIGGVMTTGGIVMSDTQFRCVPGAHAAGVVDVKVWPVNPATGQPFLLAGAFTYT